MACLRSPTAVFLALIGAFAGAGFAQDEDLAGYFGFEGLEVIRIGPQAGPLAAADMNGDGLTDLIVVNNHASRIELHYQRADAREDEPLPVPRRVNELPEHWRFRRHPVPVTHAVQALVIHDFDADGRPDLIYAGDPEEIVFLRQRGDGAFEVARRHRIRDLSANRDGLAVADVIGDERPELLSLVKGEITIWPLDRDTLGQPVELSAGERVIATILEDYDGNGRLDVAGVIPDDPAPLRLWFGGVDEGLGMLGPEIRCEMPPLMESAAVRLPDRAAARLAVIERVSRRIVIYEVATTRVAEKGDRDAAMRVHGFTDAGNRDRDHAVVDVDGDGLPDLVATDTEANAIAVYRQKPGKGLGPGELYPSLSDLTYVAAGNVDEDASAELFVLSEEEGVVGRCDVEEGRVPFPDPLKISPGRTPTALNLIHLEDGPRVAVVGKDGRDYVVDLVDMAGEIETIGIGQLSRSPDAIVDLDADQDGRTDLLLFTRDKPMMMLRASDEGFVLTESDDMGQYGLVQAARARNIAVFDIDGDGPEELLIADKNFVRAVRYDPAPPPGISPGWQVVAQINAHDASSELVSLAVLDDRIVAADSGNSRLIIMGRDEDGRWKETDSLAVRGFSFAEIHAGAFSGDGRESILAVGDNGFAVIRLTGRRIVLKETASWRTTEERRVPHELASGDVNSDGFTDLISLDAGEQMCEIFTFTQSGRMLYATGFQVFESRLFSGGQPREYESRQALIADVTGDGAEDLILLAHDRILLYPQMKAPPEE
jgi:hypothetical protein